MEIVSLEAKQQTKTPKKVNHMKYKIQFNYSILSLHANSSDLLNQIAMFERPLGFATEI